MPPAETPTRAASPGDVLIDAQSPEAAVPVRLVRDGTPHGEIEGLTAVQRLWLAASGFTPASKRVALVPDAEGGLAAVLLGIGEGRSGEPSGPAETLVGHLASVLPKGLYEIAAPGDAAAPAAIAWGLGAYRFRRYKSADAGDLARLKLSHGIDREAVLAAVEGVWLGRDLINTPANDMGPAELEAAARQLAARHEAIVTSTVGDDLLKAKLGLIHAVGRASPRAPRLIDLVWGREDAPRVTLVGKGIAFDTGGLDIKPASGMLLMKKDMGGAAAVLAAAHMVMAERLDVRLRVLIAAAENSIDGNAFRPGDVITSRSGRTVEIGNTDAEGRLVLADALSVADADAPALLMTFATLTGAARVALGPDLPALFTDDDALAAEIAAAGLAVGDPVWRLPLWRAYARGLDSDIADMGNVSDMPFAGAITAALFLQKFVTLSARYAHFDIYGWRPAARALGPKGGEPQAARAALEVIRAIARGAGSR